MLFGIGDRLRVAQVVRPAAGGIRSHVRDLINGLDQTRFSCALYAPSHLNLSVERAPHVRTDIRAGLNPVADLHAIVRLAMHLRGEADLVHAHGLRAAAIGVPAARLAGIPSIFTAHNLVSRVMNDERSVPLAGRFQRTLLTLVARRAAKVVAVSRAVMETLAAIGVPRDSIAVIPNGIDHTRFAIRYDCTAVRADYGVPPDAPLIVAVGRLAVEKGFDTLLNAFPAILAVHPEAHLIVAGDGPEWDHLRSLALRVSPYGAQRVHLVGPVTEVAPLLCAADVVAIPSRSEGQGIVALEAMAAGRAIVATRIGGLVETVHDGQWGLLVPPEAPVPLASAVAELVANAEQRARFGNAGRFRVVQEYTLDRMLSKIEALYASIGMGNRRT